MVVTCFHCEPGQCLCPSNEAIFELSCLAVGAMNPDMSACCESDYAGTMKRCCECHDLLNYNQRGHCCCVWSSLVSVMSSQHILDSEIQCAWCRAATTTTTTNSCSMFPCENWNHRSTVHDCATLCCHDWSCESFEFMEGATPSPPGPAPPPTRMCCSSCCVEYVHKRPCGARALN